MSVSVGDKAPEVTLPRDGGGAISRADHAGKIGGLYFSPRDATSGCTKQAIGFSEKRAEFEAAGAVIIGVSKDSVASHDRFKAKHGLDLALASDEAGDVVERYGVWVEKSMYGRKYMGIERSTFLIDGDGIVRQIWRKVRIPGHVDEVLSAVRALS